MAEYGACKERVWRRSRRLSRAKLEGVVTRIFGGWEVDGDAGRRRSWNISSIRVWVLPVCRGYEHSTATAADVRKVSLLVGRGYRRCALLLGRI